MATRTREILETALAAIPLNDDEYGSERQIEAQNAFAILVESLVSADVFDDIETYWLKATVEEAIEYCLRKVFA